MDALLKHASAVYAVQYFGAVLAVSVLEWISPRQPPGDAVRLRWFGNIGLALIGSTVLRAILPLPAAVWAAYCATRAWGLFNSISSPAPVTFAVTVVAFDLTAYAGHYLMHRVPLLWRIHRTHHTDHECDFSTGLRFHPFQVLFDTSMNLTAVTLLGAPVWAVLLAQTITMASNFIEHGNVRLPAGVDRLARLVLVTPDMHRIHHSREHGESRTNFGGLFSWWDRLCGTYRAEPAAGRSRIAFGVAGFLDRRHLTIPYMLVQPFLGHSITYPSTTDPQAVRAAAPAGARRLSPRRYRNPGQRTES